MAIDPKINLGMTRGTKPVPRAPLYSAIAWSNLGTDLIDRGIARQKKGDVDGAITDYSKVIEMHKNDGDPWASCAYADRGIAEEAKGDQAAAAADRQKALKMNPTLGEGLVSMHDAR